MQEKVEQKFSDFTQVQVTKYSDNSLIYEKKEKKILI